jgi:TRAP-type mannitol/chloroaromatic compound transport system permease large subunit
VLKQALENSTKLSIFVMFILIGSTVFAFTFNAADGHIWVEHLFDKLPGGQIGFLVFVNILVFALGFFIDFFEIAFIVVPLLAPVAEKLDINLIWFGIIIAMNLQTSFLTPPFGFALFYLRSVAARNDYVDEVTKKPIKRVTTEQIYKGSIAFIIIQLMMVALLIWQPTLVTGQLEAPVEVDADAVRDQLMNMGGSGDDGWGNDNPWGDEPAAEGDAASEAAPASDPAKALDDALRRAGD